jgi:hypothetical protein
MFYPTATCEIFWTERPIETLPLAYLQALAHSVEWNGQEMPEAVEVTLRIEADIVRMDDRQNDYMDITLVRCAETGETWMERDFNKKFPGVIDPVEAFEKLWEDAASDREGPETGDDWPGELYRAVRQIGEYPVPTAAGLGILSTNLQTITLQKAA